MSRPRSTRVGGLLGVREFPATALGYAGLPGWLGGFGPVALVGVEGTGSYGAGLARHLAGAGIRVVEAGRADRQDRRRQGKSDPLDAVSAARAAQSGRASGAPKGRDGAVEAIRALMVAKRSARNERTQAINQARALILTGPDDLRARFAKHAAAALADAIAALRPRPGDVPGYATRIALRELGRRARFLDAQLGRLDELIAPLAAGRAPGLLALHGVGPDTAAMLLIAAGDHPERLRSEAICQVLPTLPRPMEQTPPLQGYIDVSIVSGVVAADAEATVPSPAESSTPASARTLNCPRITASLGCNRLPGRQADPGGGQIRITAAIFRLVTVPQLSMVPGSLEEGAAAP